MALKRECCCVGEGDTLS